MIRVEWATVYEACRCCGIGGVLVDDMGLCERCTGRCRSWIWAKISAAADYWLTPEESEELARIEAAFEKLDLDETVDPLPDDHPFSKRYYELSTRRSQWSMRESYEDGVNIVAPRRNAALKAFTERRISDDEIAGWLAWVLSERPRWWREISQAQEDRPRVGRRS